MEKRYRIGFFISCIFCILLLCGLYRISYEYTKYRTEAEIAQPPALSADGNAAKNTGYYLADAGGYVVVYLYDKSTLYEYTNIRTEELPTNLESEIKDMKYIETMDELYGFLENYSS